MAEICKGQGAKKNDRGPLGAHLAKSELITKRLFDIASHCTNIDLSKDVSLEFPVHRLTQLLVRDTRRSDHARFSGLNLNFW